MGGQGKKRKQQQQQQQQQRKDQAAEERKALLKESEQCGCPHVKKGITLNNVRGAVKHSSIPSCKDCGSNESKPSDVSICLGCGRMGCGRHTKSDHAKAHFFSMKTHALVVDTTKFEVWCYVCERIVKPPEDSTLLACLYHIRSCLSDDPVPISATSQSKSGGKLGGTSSGAHSSAISAKLMPGRPVRGLSNLGNSCFFNSIIQCLNQATQLWAALDRVKPPGHEVTIKADHLETVVVHVQLSPGALTEAMRGLGTAIEAGGDYSVSPRQVFDKIAKYNPRFSGYQQQDSHELLRSLLDNLRNEERKRVRGALLKVLKLEKTARSALTPEQKESVQAYGRAIDEMSFLNDVFFGRTVSAVTCLECDTVSRNYEDFLDLSLPLPDDIPIRGSAVAAGYSGSSKSSKARQQQRHTGKAQDSAAVATLSPVEAVLNSLAETKKPKITKHQAKKEARKQKKDTKRRVKQKGKHEEAADDDGPGDSEVSPSSSQESGCTASQSTAGTGNVDTGPSDKAGTSAGSPGEVADSWENLADEEEARETPDECTPTIGDGDLPSESKQNSADAGADSGLSADLGVSSDSQGIGGNGDGDSSFSSTIDHGSCRSMDADSGLSEMSGDVSDMSSPGSRVVSQDEIVESAPLGSLALDMTSTECSSQVQTAETNQECTGDRNTEPQSVAATDGEAAVVEEAPPVESDPQKTEVTEQKCSLLVTADNDQVPTSSTATLTASGSDGTDGMDQVEDSGLAAQSSDTGAGASLVPNDPADAAVPGSDEDCDVLFSSSDTENNAPPATDVDTSNWSAGNVSTSASADSPHQVENVPASAGADASPSDMPAAVQPAESVAITTSATESNGQLEEQDMASPSSGSGLVDFGKVTTMAESGLLDWSLEGSLARYINAELLDGVNKFACDACTERMHGPAPDGEDDKRPPVKTIATKQLMIEALPPVLTLHLKRFKVTSHTRVQKINKHVSFPLLLDVMPYCGTKTVEASRDVNGKIIYSLFAVSVHSGGMGGGHYVAYVKSRAPTTSTTAVEPPASADKAQSGDDSSKQTAPKAESDSEQTPVSVVSAVIDTPWATPEIASDESAPVKAEEQEAETEVEAEAAKADAVEYRYDPPAGVWYYASDSSVRSIAESEVLRAQAYVLFYERIHPTRH